MLNCSCTGRRVAVFRLSHLPQKSLLFMTHLFCYLTLRRGSLSQVSAARLPSVFAALPQSSPEETPPLLELFDGLSGLFLLPTLMGTSSTRYRYCARLFTSPWLFHTSSATFQAPRKGVLATASEVAVDGGVRVCPPNATVYAANKFSCPSLSLPHKRCCSSREIRAREKRSVFRGFKLYREFSVDFPHPPTNNTPPPPHPDKCGPLLLVLSPPPPEISPASVRKFTET